jgi:RES domain-containing protein
VGQRGGRAAIRRPLEFARPEIVYCSIDPATAILEVAVHKGFKALDTVPHVLTSVVIAEPAAVHVVPPGVVPNANWLRPGVPGAGQQAFGDGLLSAYPFVLIPSAVSTHSWNLLFDTTLPTPVRDAGAGRFRAGHAAASPPA